MSRLSFSLAVTLGLFVALPALAGNTCYSPQQVHAEQLLRLHSELMVITVSCREGSDGQSLPRAYGDFTKKNIHALHEAEQTMMDYYHQNAKGDATEHLDKLRTILANEFGQKSADMGATRFCETYRDKVLKFDAASTSDVENEAERMTIADRTFVVPCGIPQAQMAKGK